MCVKQVQTIISVYIIHASYSSSPTFKCGRLRQHIVQSGFF